MLRLIDQLAKKWGDVDFQQLRILSHVAVNPGCQIIEVSDVLRMDYRACKFEVGQLACGVNNRPGLCLIDKEPAPDDKRAVALYLSKTGKRLMKLAEPILNLESVPVVPANQMKLI